MSLNCFGNNWLLHRLSNSMILPPLLCYHIRSPYQYLSLFYNDLLPFFLYRISYNRVRQIYEPQSIAIHDRTHDTSTNVFCWIERKFDLAAVRSSHTDGHIPISSSAVISIIILSGSFSLPVSRHCPKLCPRVHL